MSTVGPLVAAVRSDKDLLPSDELGHEDQPQISEDLVALDDLPQGALVVLMQLQPLRELPLKPSLATLRPVAEREFRSAKVSVDQAMHLPTKQPSVPLSPAPVDTRLALLATRFPPVAQTPVQASVANALAVPAQAAVDGSVQQNAPLSPTRLPVAMQTQEPDRTAAASALWARDQAATDKPVKQETAQALPAQPPPLLEKSLPLHPATGLALAAKPNAEAKSLPEASTAREGGAYLQVPFSKGNAVSLITVSKVGGERPEQLLLNPDSSFVSSFLSDHLAQVPDSRWRLADQQGHEDRPEQARPDEEVEEEGRQTLPDRSEQAGQQA